MQEGGLSAISADEPVVRSSEVKQLKNRIWELELLLGRKTFEVEILEEAVEISRSKKRISRSSLPPPDGVPDEAGSQTLEVSRPNLSERRDRPRGLRPSVVILK